MITPNDSFPYLTDDNHRSSSPPTPDYNCVAWSARDTEHWWQPGVFWPVSAPPDDFGVGILVLAFEAQGYQTCDHGRLELMFEKVALYGNNFFYTHVARQLPDGRWTSKLGRAEDIEHQSPDDLAGGMYGEVVQYMRRAIQTI
jgi:hypothetical protein